ncbi:MAG: hypothetical protein LBM28_06555, partial [Oscillospiraceae bacterium]|nr:hypothetical protein [Oscillospiraceae bacterium]
MTKRLLAILLACILVLGITACGESAESGFSVKNELAFEVHSLYIVPAGAAEWGEDLLVAALPSGNSVALALPSEGKAGEFDIRLIDADGDDYYFYGVPIASGTSLRVEYNDNWDCVIVASPKKGDAVTVKGEFQFSGSMGNDEPEDEEFFPTIGGASEVGDFGGGIQDKDYSLGIAAIYPDGFGSVLDESEKAFIVHDNSENCVVILNVTEEYL